MIINNNCNMNSSNRKTTTDNSELNNNNKGNKIITMMWIYEPAEIGLLIALNWPYAHILQTIIKWYRRGG